MTRFPAWIRLFAAFAVTLVAGEHSLASLHQALTPHEVCAEHGELTHADHEAGTGTAHGSAPAVDARPEAEAEHHHCGVVPAAPERAPVVSSSSECTVAAATLLAVVGSFERALVSVDVLSFAPKLSPPA